MLFVALRRVGVSRELLTSHGSSLDYCNTPRFCTATVPVKPNKTLKYRVKQNQQLLPSSMPLELCFLRT